MIMKQLESLFLKILSLRQTFRNKSRDDSDDQTATSSSITVTSNWVSEEDKSLVVGQDGIDVWQDCGSGIGFNLSFFFSASLWNEFDIIFRRVGR